MQIHACIGAYVLTHKCICSRIHGVMYTKWVYMIYEYREVSYFSKFILSYPLYVFEIILVEESKNFSSSNFYASFSIFHTRVGRYEITTLERVTE
jgi:hypothetical protein